MMVELAGDHPGVADPEYRQRRDAIAAAAQGLEPGEEARDIEYTAAETETWRQFSTVVSRILMAR